MAKTFVKREDGEHRAAVAIWVHLTKAQIDELERLLRASATTVGLHDLLRMIAEDGIDRAISSDGEYLPTDRDLWASRRAR